MNAVTLPLLRGQISQEDALEADRDIIQQLSYPEKRIDFYLYLYQHRSEIAQVLSRHLGIPTNDFRLGEVEEWLHGSFNVCLPIYIGTGRGPLLPRRVILRLPLPYKVGESFHPGNVDEKLRCEAATYIRLQSQHPAVPIPRLFGFGFPGTQSFTLYENETLWNRITWFWRRGLAWLHGESLPLYFAHARHGLFDVGYLVIEHVDEGVMLSATWNEEHYDPIKRANLFHSLSRIILDLARLPLPRIGSWTMDDRGILTLTNRPLTFCIHEMENNGIPTALPRDLTYMSIESYYLDLIACHDERIRRQPNSIHDQDDGERQLAALTGMRTLLPKFTDRRSHGKPFILSLTDLHQSNIFVDNDWHVKRIIDLEWACSQPIQMLNLPHWLVGKGVDQLTGSCLDEYKAVYDEFLYALEEEEALSGELSNTCSKTIRENWSTGRNWYLFALAHSDALWSVFSDHIQPRFGEFNGESDKAIMQLWDEGASEFVSSKVAEQELYNIRICEMFARAAARDADSREVDDAEGNDKCDSTE
ncbi:hypothetical protein K431DRAFT_336174 [Polychaeton citri CBS 116435]|uniref:Aminoglycoside phosphotransferase domain-containing protein n=1 Tax=Polychaeton citri CBS 116435 TaxID=1314669 RepID=A0A9P4URJ5_9PEZI|nr:hypothetical protein K431DRAFT_336174 [Polychaeton citri CBS 116435]